MSEASTSYFTQALSTHEVQRSVLQVFDLINNSDSTHSAKLQSFGRQYSGIIRFRLNYSSMLQPIYPLDPFTHLI